MWVSLALCVFCTFSTTFCDVSDPGRRIYTTSASAGEGITTKRSDASIITPLRRRRSRLMKTVKTSTTHPIPAAYRKECEDIQPCVDHILRISKKFADINHLFNGEDKGFDVQDYFNYNFLNTEEIAPCDKYPYDNETFVAMLNICSGKSRPPGPRYVPTSGEVWPKPYYQKKTNFINKINVNTLNVKVNGYKCCIIDKAVERSLDYIHTLTNLSKKYSESGNFRQYSKILTEFNLEVKLTKIAYCEGLYPQSGMDESYNLTVSHGTASIFSPSVWGLLRGIETFNHLLWLPINFEYIGVNNTIIDDKPNYPHRGLLVDTARHYISVDQLLSTLDAMAMNKMNVFHWHIIDDESFPLQSDRFPEMSEKGAFHPSMVYNKTHLITIRDFARDRGIRVIVEIDMPGHAASWGASHMEIITQECVKISELSPPMNPIEENTYKLVHKVINEIQSTFPDHYLHLGGDEVNKKCWCENLEIQKYLAEHDMDTDDLLNIFYQRVVGLLKNDTVPVVWEEVFTSNVNITPNTVIQTWLSDDGLEVVTILNAGYSVIRSNYYYMDHLATTFDQYYAAEPRKCIKNLVKKDALKNLLGGEACMWGEMVDVSNLLSRVWPRTSAIAEVLWSETEGKSPDGFTHSRIEEHVCRMQRRRVPTEPPNGPGFCVFE